MSYLLYNGIYLPVHGAGFATKCAHPWPLTKEEDDKGYKNFYAAKNGKGGILLPLELQWRGLSDEERKEWASDTPPMA